LAADVSAGGDGGLC